MSKDKKQRGVRKNIREIQNVINNAIDRLCVEGDYQITFAEINAALTDILRSNLDCELKTIWQEEQEEQE